MNHRKPADYSFKRNKSVYLWILILLTAAAVLIGTYFISVGRDYDDKPDSNGSVWVIPTHEKPSESLKASAGTPVDPAWKKLFEAPLTDADIPEFGILKFGKPATYVYDLKVAITQPSKAGDFKVILDAPKGWVVDGDEYERSQVTYSAAGSLKFDCKAPFSEDLLPGTVKTYDCSIKGFGKDSTDYLAVMAADFVLPMWTETGKPY